MIRNLIGLAPAAALGACAGGHAATPSPAAFLPAALVEESLPPMPPEHPVAAPAPQRLDVREMPKEAGAPAARIAAANRAALREPTRAGYAEAVQVYAYAPGALFRLYASPGHVSEIALQPGEALVSVAAGDTARWVIGDTSSGSGGGRRTHILVKPSSAGLSTNIVIATDRRVYHVAAESTARTAMASLSWTYPEDALLALRREEGARPVAGEVALDRLEFGYRITGDDPPWRPIRAFDDGKQVFIEFPPAPERQQAPPLFVLGRGGAELVNYRLRGNYYVVDRLFGAAELRLGEKPQTVVRITRDGAVDPHGRRGKARP